MSVYSSCAVAICILMFAVWLISLPLRDVSIVDLVWGLGFAVVAWTSYFTSHGNGPDRWLLPLLTTIWAVRLSGYLALRNHGQPEDKRYAAMRERAGSRFPMQSLVTIFGLQGVIMWLVSLPLQVGIRESTGNWTILHAVGLLLWAIGVSFETFGDWQLARFKSNPSNSGKVLNTGLWRYTRHPNYFGDFMVWWGFYFLAIAEGQPLWTIVGPVLMSFFLMKVSGVPMLEKTLTKTRAGYGDYIATTNAFFPWFPKRVVN